MSSPSEQRREAFRVGLAAPAHVRRALGSVTSVEVRDLSVGGARLVGPSEMHVDEEIELELTLGVDRISVRALVVRLDAQGCGVRFAALPRALEHRISRFLTDEQRRRARPRA